MTATTVDDPQIHMGYGNLHPVRRGMPVDWVLWNGPHATPEDELCIATGSRRNPAAAERQRRNRADVSR